MNYACKLPQPQTCTTGFSYVHLKAGDGCLLCRCAILAVHVRVIFCITVLDIEFESQVCSVGFFHTCTYLYIPVHTYIICIWHKV